MKLLVDLLKIFSFLHLWSHFIKTFDKNIFKLIFWACVVNFLRSKIFVEFFFNFKLIFQTIEVEFQFVKFEFQKFILFFKRLNIISLLIILIFLSFLRSHILIALNKRFRSRFFIIRINIFYLLCNEFILLHCIRLLDLKQFFPESFYTLNTLFHLSFISISLIFIIVEQLFQLIKLYFFIFKVQLLWIKLLFV